MTTKAREYADLERNPNFFLKNKWNPKFVWFCETRYSCSPKSRIIACKIHKMKLTFTTISKSPFFPRFQYMEFCYQRRKISISIFLVKNKPKFVGFYNFTETCQAWPWLYAKENASGHMKIGNGDSCYPSLFMRFHFSLPHFSTDPEKW